MPGAEVEVKIEQNDTVKLPFKGRRLKNLLMIAGEELVKISERAFELQEWDGKRWPERSVPNLPGVLRDLERGPSIQQKRFESRPALVDTGFLKDSIEYALVGNDTLRIYSSEKYAQLHQEGGEWSMPVTETAKRNLRNVLAIAAEGSKPDEYRSALAWLAMPSTKSIGGEVPARPFLGFPRTTNQVINTVINLALKSAANERLAPGEEKVAT